MKLYQKPRHLRRGKIFGCCAPTLGVVFVLLRVRATIERAPVRTSYL
jgi:hypothetical protein